MVSEQQGQEVYGRGVSATPPPPPPLLLKSHRNGHTYGHGPGSIKSEWESRAAVTVLSSIGPTVISLNIHTKSAPGRAERRAHMSESPLSQALHSPPRALLSHRSCSNKQQQQQASHSTRRRHGPRRSPLFKIVTLPGPRAAAAAQLQVTVSCRSCSHGNKQQQQRRAASS